MTKKELFLSEDQARRLWERAAQLQNDAAEREKAAEGDPGSREKGGLLSGVEDESAGYSLTHVREAGEEIGIRSDFLDLALAEEAILELEGGGQNGFWDKTSERFLKDKGRVFEVRRRFPLPARRVWLALEEVLTSENHGLDLLGFRGGNPDEGGIALFESPYSYVFKSGSLQYNATGAEVRRFMVRVTPEEDGGCVVLISAPLRRSRRVNGAVGLAVSFIGGLAGGGLGIGLTALVVGTGGVGAVPAVLGMAAAGVLGGERFTRWGYIHAYRYALRSLEKTFQKILTRVERDVQRAVESAGQEERRSLPPPRG